MNNTPHAELDAQAVFADSSGSYRWALVGMLWFICFFNYADRVAISSVFPVLQKQYHFTKTELGWIGAAFTWVYAGFAPIAGDTGDRFPRKWVILTGLYIWSAITGLTGLCTRVWQFVAVRGAEGLGETFLLPGLHGVNQRLSHTGRPFSEPLVCTRTSIYAGTIFGGTVAGLLAEKHGWQTPFWAFAAAGITLGAILNRYIPDPREISCTPNRYLEPSSSVLTHMFPPMRVFLVQLGKTPTAALLLAAYFGANMVGFIPLTWMPTFIKEKFHVNLATAGFFATVFIQSASMVGAVVGGVMADSRVRKRIQGRIEVQAAAILLGTPFLFLCGWAATKSTASYRAMLFWSLQGYLRRKPDGGILRRYCAGKAKHCNRRDESDWLDRCRHRRSCRGIRG